MTVWQLKEAFLLTLKMEIQRELPPSRYFTLTNDLGIPLLDERTVESYQFRAPETLQLQPNNLITVKVIIERKAKYKMYFLWDRETLVSELYTRVSTGLHHEQLADLDQYRLWFQKNPNYTGIQLEPDRTVASYRLLSYHQLVFMKKEKTVIVTDDSSTIATDSVFLAVECQELGLRSVLLTNSNAMINEVYNVFVAKHLEKLMTSADEYALHEAENGEEQEEEQDEEVEEEEEEATSDEEVTSSKGEEGTKRVGSRRKKRKFGIRVVPLDGRRIVAMVARSLSLSGMTTLYFERRVEGANYYQKLKRSKGHALNDHGVDIEAKLMLKRLQKKGAGGGGSLFLGDDEIDDEMMAELEALKAKGRPRARQIDESILVDEEIDEDMQAMLADLQRQASEALAQKAELDRIEREKEEAARAEAEAAREKEKEKERASRHSHFESLPGLTEELDADMLAILVELQVEKKRKANMQQEDPEAAASPPARRIIYNKAATLAREPAAKKATRRQQKNASPMSDFVRKAGTLAPEEKHKAKAKQRKFMEE